MMTFDELHAIRSRVLRCASRKLSVGLWPQLRLLSYPSLKTPVMWRHGTVKFSAVLCFPSALATVGTAHLTGPGVRAFDLVRTQRLRESIPTTSDSIAIVT